MENLQGLTALTLFLSIFSMIFWMVVTWRAMRAHEKIADAVEQLMHRQAANPETQAEWRAMRAHEKIADAVEHLTHRQAANPETQAESSQES